MTEVLIEIINAKDTHRIDDIITALLNAYAIYPNIPDFWLQIKTGMKENYKLFTPQTVTKIMKKFFETVIHETAQNHATIIFSGGKIGYQVEISIENLSKVIRFSLGDICDMITEEKI